jgi:hypothetical protein
MKCAEVLFFSAVCIDDELHVSARPHPGLLPRGEGMAAVAFPQLITVRQFRCDLALRFANDIYDHAPWLLNNTWCREMAQPRATIMTIVVDILIIVSFSFNISPASCSEIDWPARILHPG